MSTLVQPALAPEDTLSTAVTAAPLAVPASASPAGDVGAPWFEKNLPALKDALTQIPGAQQGVEKILSSYLQAAITADTSDGLLLAMQCYLGDGPADLLLTLLTRGIDDRALFQQVADRLEPSDRPWAQLLLGVYGRRVRDAWVVGGELPDDWMTLNHEVNYSLYAENWLVRTTVIKYSGASFTVESRPGAYVNLVGAMSKVLTDLPDPGKASLPLPKLKEILDQWNELTWTVARLSRGERVAAALEALPAATDFATRTRWLRDIPHRHLTRQRGGCQR